ncbi:50S ribosomal protein L1 [Patescibacteria group bacterium]
MARSRKYEEALALLEKDRYEIDEAVELLEKTSVTSFDSSCEVHFNLGIDPKQADQNIRTSVSLPHGTGKEIRIVAFVSEDKIKEAKSAGAVEAGTEELIKKIEKGWLDFDATVATPDQMKSIGKVAKILGQKRLMPNPKVGTVTPDFVKIIEELKKGKIEMRVDKEGNLHMIFGKVSFGIEKLKENLMVLVKAVLDAKPASSKGNYIRTIALTTSMGPSIKLDISKASEQAK